MYEDCISSVVKVLREGDLNVELGLMSIDEKDNEELTKMYGTLC